MIPNEEIVGTHEGRAWETEFWIIRFSSPQIQPLIKNACKKLGLFHLTHHDLRHLFATRCIESGVDIPTVAKWLGHKDGGVLAMQTYGHLRDKHSANMAEKVIFGESVTLNAPASPKPTRQWSPPPRMAVNGGSSQSGVFLSVVGIE